MQGPTTIGKRLARAAIRRGLQSPRLRSIIETELRRTKRPPMVSMDATDAPPPFTDRHGTVHMLDAKARDRLKPGWRAMCDPVASALPPSDDALRARIGKAVVTASEAERVIELVVGAPLAGKILEVGCYDGAIAFELARRAGNQLVASDLARYYVVQRPRKPEPEHERERDAIAAKETALADLRERVRVMTGMEPGRVTFVEDDITASALEPGSFDCIVSFEVLEHVARPHDAFAAMARLLRPGGVMYHDYNPFFSAIDGHSLATLDVPWGHARFDADDVGRYLRLIRPSEADQALRFYRESLNRMTLVDLRAAIADAGLDGVSIMPWHQRALLADVSPQVLVEVQRNYPSATIEDLLASFVAVVARRPAGPP